MSSLHKDKNFSEHVEDQVKEDHHTVTFAHNVNAKYTTPQLP